MLFKGLSMNVVQDHRIVGDGWGGYGGYGHGMGCGTGYSSACSLGVGGLVLLFIFLIIIAWAVHSGHDRTRDHITSGNALLLASRQDNQALAIAIARNEGRQDAVTAAILTRVDANGDRLCGLARQVDNDTNRIIERGETFGFRAFEREPLRNCCDRDRDFGRGGQTIVDFNTGVQTGLALGTRGISNQQGPLLGGGTVV